MLVSSVDDIWIFNQDYIPWRRRQWHPTLVLLPGKSHGWRSLVGCSPWGLEESDTTERLHFHFSLSCSGEGNGNPLQCSCLENPWDRGAWWAAVYGVAQSWTRLNRLSSSSRQHIKKQRHYFVNKGLSSQGYGFSSGHVWMWEVNYEESWAPKNWCFWTVVWEKTLESPLDCKEIQPVHPKDQSLVFIERSVVEAETPILWPPDAKSWLTGKHPDAGKDWGQEKKGTTEDKMVGWHHRLNRHEFGWTPGAGDGQGGLACCGSWGPKESDTTEWLNWLNWLNWKILSF